MRELSLIFSKTFKIKLPKEYNFTIGCNIPFSLILKVITDLKIILFYWFYIYILHSTSGF